MEEANKSDQQFLDLTIVAKTDLTDYGLKKVSVRTNIYYNKN
jgi:hypothetical protein